MTAIDEYIEEAKKIAKENKRLKLEQEKAEEQRQEARYKERIQEFIREGDNKIGRLLSDVSEDVRLELDGMIKYIPKELNYDLKGILYSEDGYRTDGIKIDIPGCKTIYGYTSCDSGTGKCFYLLSINYLKWIIGKPYKLKRFSSFEEALLASKGIKV